MPTRENQYACHDLLVWNTFNKRPKFTFVQSKHFPPKHNLPDKENNYFAWGKSRVLSTHPLFLQRRGNNNYRPLHGTCTLCMNKHLIFKAVGRTQKTSFPLSSNSKASLCSDFKTNPSSWANKFRQSISVYSSGAVRNIANDLLKTLLDSLLTACIEI